MIVRVLSAFVALGTIALSAQSGPSVVRTFDADSIGAPPPGFVFAATREAAPNRWVVERDGTNHHIVHAADLTPGAGIAMAILEGLQLRELEVSVRLRMIEGERTGGVVWRYQDPSNYYFARLRLTGEQSVGLYRMVNGNRVRLEDEDDLELDPTAWHTLKVVQVDTEARVYLGGIKVFEIRDRLREGTGGAGVWCGGNSGARFDDLHVAPRDGGPQDSRRSVRNH